VVDDFGVKYRFRSDFDFIVSCLSTLYHVKAPPIASKFLGFSVFHYCSAQTFTVSYPGYVPSLLTRLRPLWARGGGGNLFRCKGTCGRKNPSVYASAVVIQHVYHRHLKLLGFREGWRERSGPVGDWGGGEIRRRVDCTLWGNCREVSRLQRLLGYVGAHPDGWNIFRASDMVLRVLSDASYLSCSRP
jgi:hypothetical protein